MGVGELYSRFILLSGDIESARSMCPCVVLPNTALGFRNLDTRATAPFVVVPAIPVPTNVVIMPLKVDTIMTLKLPVSTMYILPRLSPQTDCGEFNAPEVAATPELLPEMYVPANVVMI